MRWLGRTLAIAWTSRWLPVEQEYRRHCCQRSTDLQSKDESSLTWCLRYPLEGEKEHNRYLSGHEELPDVRGTALIWLRRGAVCGEEDQYGGERDEGHCHG